MKTETAKVLVAAEHAASPRQDMNLGDYTRLRKAAAEALEILCKAFGAKNLTCHIYNPYSELYWLFLKAGNFDYEYQLSGPLAHPDANKRFEVQGNRTFSEEGFEITFFDNPLPIDLTDDVLAAVSFNRREKIRHPVRVKLTPESPGAPAAFVFINFAGENLPQTKEALSQTIMGRLSMWRPVLLELAKEPRLDKQTAWLLRSINIKVRNKLRNIWLGSAESSDRMDTSSELQDLYNLIAKSIMTVLVRPSSGAKNVLCTLSTVDANNNVQPVGRFPPDLQVPSERGIVDHVAHTGGFFLIKDINHYNERRKSVAAEDPCLPRFVVCNPAVQCELTVPLVIHSRVVGVINIEADKTDAYDDGHVLLLSHFASTVALVVRLATLFKDLNIATKLQRDLLEASDDRSVFLTVLEACRHLGYTFPAIWDLENKAWIALKDDQTIRNKPRLDAFTAEVVHEKTPLAIANIRLGANRRLTFEKACFGQLDRESGLFRGWLPRSPNVKTLNPDVEVFVNSPDKVVTDVAFPIINNDEVRAVLWAKCFRHFVTLLDDECWCLSLLCRSATVALKAVRDRMEKERLLEEQAMATIHAIKNEIFPIGGAEHQIRKVSGILTEFPDSQAILLEVNAMLRQVYERFQYLAKCIPQYLKGKIPDKSKKWFDLNPVLRDEVGILSKWAGSYLKAEFIETQRQWLTFGDQLFLTMAFKELLLNAYHAVYFKVHEQRGSGILDFEGRCTVTVSANNSGQLCVDISDNGIGCCEGEARGILEEKWAARKHPPKFGQIQGLGLRFIDWVVSEHEGRIDLLFESDKWTRFRLYFPKYTQQNT